MKLGSEVISNVLKILLWLLFATAASDLAETIVFAAAPYYFVDHLYSSYSFVAVLAVVLYWIVVVIYLIWIYRVHMDLRQRYPFYSRSPGRALACILVPFYNLYGIPAIYLSIGRQFQSASPRLYKEGSRIVGLAVPLLIGLIVVNALTRAINRADDPSNALLLVSGGATLALYGMFLAICLAVSQGLRKAFADADATEGAPVGDTVDVAEAEASPAGPLA